MVLDRKKILLIYTGGTIGMVLNESESSYHPFNFDEVEQKFPELQNLSCDIEVVSFDPPLDSSNIGAKIWIKIARIIEQHYQVADGFVILHGSDTMAYTGSALSFILEGLSKPVILTGAQLPIGEIRTDAKENLITALEIAAYPETPIREVCIYFEYKLYRANRTKKIKSDVFSAFGSPNIRPIAVAGVHIKFYHPTPPDGYKNMQFRVHDKLNTNIGLVKFYPELPPSFLKAVFCNPDLQGIVLESYGSGNLPTETNFIETIKTSIDHGKIILNITQCGGGSVEMGRYATSKKLQEMGVLSGKDLTTEAATTKMMYLLGKYDDPEKVKYYLTRNIRGEMTSDRAYTTEFIT